MREQVNTPAASSATQCRAVTTRFGASIVAEQMWSPTGVVARSNTIASSALGEGDASASALAGRLPVTRQAIAKHLSVLQEVGLVEPVRVGREVAGRGGKGVSVITGLPLAGAELEALARRLKKLCGAGGAVREGVIEIQGEHRERLVAELCSLGYEAKRSGG